MRNDPHFCTIPATTLSTILSIKKPEDITSVEIVNEYVDDDLQCIDAKINGTPVSFWYLTNAQAGAFFYPESTKAKASIFRSLKAEISAGVSEMLDMPLEDFKQEINKYRANYEVVFFHVKRLRKNNILRRECTYALQEKVQKGLVDDHFNIIG
jgi:hypothetical protein